MAFSSDVSMSFIQLSLHDLEAKVEWDALLKSYALAVTASCSIAVGAGLEAQNSARLLGNVRKPGIDQRESHCTFGIGPDWSRCQRYYRFVQSCQQSSQQTMRSFDESSAIFASHGAICTSAFVAIGLVLDLSVLHHGQHMSPWSVNCPVLKKANMNKYMIK